MACKPVHKCNLRHASSASTLTFIHSCYLNVYILFGLSLLKANSCTAVTNYVHTCNFRAFSIRIVHKKTQKIVRKSSFPTNLRLMASEVFLTISSHIVLQEKKVDNPIEQHSHNHRNWNRNDPCNNDSAGYSPFHCREALRAAHAKNG